MYSGEDFDFFKIGRKLDIFFFANVGQVKDYLSYETHWVDHKFHDQAQYDSPYILEKILRVANIKLLIVCYDYT